MSASPFRLTLKLATSLDGQIALGNGESQWITGEAARREGHHLRAAHDAVIVGSGTVVADDPLLTVRNISLAPARQPWRVVLDRRGRVANTCQLFRTASENQPAIWVREGEAPPHPHVTVLSPQDSLAATLAEIAAITGPALFLEGGGELMAAALQEDLGDRLEWFRAPLIIGADGRSGLGALGVRSLSDTKRWKRVGMHRLGEDVWERFERPCSQD